MRRTRAKPLPPAVDRGALRINSKPWTPGPNRADLGSVGLGSTWIGQDQWQGQVQIAKPIGAETPWAATQAGARIWVWPLKGFWARLPGAASAWPPPHRL